MWFCGCAYTYCDTLHARASMAVCLCKYMYTYSTPLGQQRLAHTHARTSSYTIEQFVDDKSILHYICSVLISIGCFNKIPCTHTLALPSHLSNTFHLENEWNARRQWSINNNNNNNNYCYSVPYLPQYLARPHHSLAHSSHSSC